MGGGGGSGEAGPAATRAAPGTDESAGAIAGGNMLDAAIGNMMQTAASKALNALEGPQGADAGGGGGASDANVVGPVGDVDGVDATDRAKGPGHSILKVTGSHNETAAALKVLATVNGINTNIAGSVTQNVGAAHVELVLGDFAEAVQGSKMEKEIGLIVVAKGESEHVGGAKTAMIGGAVIDKVKGNLSIEAAANLTMIGAMHKFDASSSITLKCGGSELTIDGGGVTIKSAMVTVTGGAIQLPKPASEGG
jgi:type VI secretion system secreted protein VgrG